MHLPVLYGLGWGPQSDISILLAGVAISDLRSEQILPRRRALRLAWRVPAPRPRALLTERSEPCVSFSPRRFSAGHRRREKPGDPPEHADVTADFHAAVETRRRETPVRIPATIQKETKLSSLGSLGSIEIRARRLRTVPVACWKPRGIITALSE